MFTEDFTAFFDVAGGFAVAATLGGVAVQGIYTAAAADAASMGYGAGLDTLRPTFVLPSTQAAAAAGQTLVIPGQGSWTVVGIEPDGTGISTLQLEKP